MKITILGCGSSGGVPTITGDWGACCPENWKNRRRRVCVLVDVDGLKILIDASPDLREQFLDNHIQHVDAIIITHAHADHIGGLPDLRPLYYEGHRRIPLYANESTLNELNQVFGYALLPLSAGYPPFLEGRAIVDHRINFSGLEIQTIEQQHGPHNFSLGVRMGSFAYSTDVSDLSDAAIAQLQGLDYWVVDCLRYEPHPTHFHLEKTLEMVEKVRPKKAVLTHMAQQLDYAELRAQLPVGIVPAYDGMTIEISYV